MANAKCKCKEQEKYFFSFFLYQFQSNNYAIFHNAIYVRAKCSTRWRMCQPRGATWVNFCWVCAAGLLEPLPHYSLFCGQL